MITWGRWWWPVFLIASGAWIILAFGIPEIIALLTARATHTDNTLSNYSWSELHVSTELTVHTVAWYVSFAVWCVLVFVLTLHIWFHQFSLSNP